MELIIGYERRPSGGRVDCHVAGQLRAGVSTVDGRLRRRRVEYTSGSRWRSKAETISLCTLCKQKLLWKTQRQLLKQDAVAHRGKQVKNHENLRMALEHGKLQYKILWPQGGSPLRISCKKTNGRCRGDLFWAQGRTFSHICSNII